MFHSPESCRTPEWRPLKIQVTSPDTVITLDHVGPNPIALDDLMHELEKKTIGELLAHTGGVKSTVAKLLKMNRTTLVEKAKRYGFPLKTK